MSALLPPAAPEIVERAPLASCTTLSVGGPARWQVDIRAASALSDALRWAAERGAPVVVLGGGSNVLIADTGFDGLVVRPRIAGLVFGEDGRLWIGAGEVWDTVVDAAVARGWQGLECLTGIPGWAGAAPLQNIGAYGQEVADVVERVDTVGRDDGAPAAFDRAACAFGYRDSRFKRETSHIVVGLEMRLRPHAPGHARYAELARTLGVDDSAPVPLADLRRAVRSLRAAKGMLHDPAGLAAPDARSAGSFFTNPVVEVGLADTLPAEAPRYPVAAAGQVKLSAAWLVEHAGWVKGRTLGNAGISSRHSLALVNRGGATALEIATLAAHVRADVRRRFGVTLSPEPVFLGFELGADALLESLAR
jgi:UDP-N-acetylmuramate dehydrogenase